MTSGSSNPPASSKNEAEYARKLALALLSTLESKGLLTKLDVDTILAVAHRAALQTDTASGVGAGEASLQAGTDKVSPEPGRDVVPEPSAPVVETPEKSVINAPVEVKRPLGPAVLGTRWIKPDSAGPVRTETEDLLQHGEAVKVVGKANGESSTGRRPLAPAILTGNAPAIDEESAMAQAEIDDENAVRESVRPELSAMTGSKVEGGVTGGKGDTSSVVTDDAESKTPATENGARNEQEGATEKKTGLPLVIDFELD